MTQIMEQNTVHRFVFDSLRNKHRMPRTALRYAIEKMPAEMKKCRERMWAVTPGRGEHWDRSGLRAHLN